MSENPKDLSCADKVQLGMMPAAGRIYGALAAMHGARKYGPYNWRDERIRYTNYLDAIEGHVLALREGHDRDDDSMVHHLGHVIQTAAILADSIEGGFLIDDRPSPGPIRDRLIGSTNGRGDVAVTYSDDFEAAMVGLLDEEGGYSNDPDDPGGETKYGIDKATYPNVDIKTLTIEGAKAIYWRDWWSPLLDHGVPPKTLAKLFDVSVNIGKGRAYKFLQRAVFATADGQIGPLTEKAIVDFPLIVTLPADQFIRGCIRMQQYGYYEGLVAGNPRLKKYIGGWLARASRMFGNVSQTLTAKE